MDKTPPTRHYGFAQVPRQITRGEKYKKDLSLAEKGLYTCLKDICGDTGECYYSLRNLALEIGTSASTLTRLIPALRAAGIIYAEKKIRGTGGSKHEIWHIRIVNIWQENDALYKTEECFKMKQSDDTTVSDCNKDARVFQNETGLFQNETKIVSFCLPNNNNSNNNLTEEEGTLATNVASPTDHLSSLPDDALIDEIHRREKEKLDNASPIATTPIENVESKATRNTPSKSGIRVTRQRKTEPLQKPLPKLEEPAFSTEKARAVWDEWVTMPYHGGIKPKLTVTARDHCETLSLADESITRDTIFKVRRFAHEHDTSIKGWELGNMTYWYPRWKSAEYEIPAIVAEQKLTVGNRHLQRFS